MGFWTTLLKVSSEFHINPYVLLGAICLIYTLLGFSKNNKELHKFKDNEIDRLKKEKQELRNELAMFKSLKRQSEFLKK